LKKEVSVKFTITKSNHIIIECKINSIKARLIVDTGASNSCINYFSNKKFKLKFKRSNEKASSATDEINEIFLSKNNTIIISNHKIKNFEFILFDMTHINNSFKEKEIMEVDGIIGGDILKEFNAKINYRNRLMVLNF